MMLTVPSSGTHWGVIINAVLLGLSVVVTAVLALVAVSALKAADSGRFRTPVLVDSVHPFRRFSYTLLG
jgi:hypothetical protein